MFYYVNIACYQKSAEDMHEREGEDAAEEIWRRRKSLEMGGKERREGRERKREGRNERETGDMKRSSPRGYLSTEVISVARRHEERRRGLPLRLEKEGLRRETEGEGDERTPLATEIISVARQITRACARDNMLIRHDNT